MTHIDEPMLSFGFNQQAEHPKDGLFLYGPPASNQNPARMDVGVIGTAGTIRSRAYEKEIVKLLPDVALTVQACALFVPLVEEGWIDTEPTRAIARSYLERFVAADVDTLVLGCTHYPLMKSVIGDVVGREIRLIDSAHETAREAAALLRANSLENATPNDARYRFIASDAPETFLSLGQRFLGSAIDRVETRTLG